MVLLVLPASVTDRCIALETRLSDLLIPKDPNPKANTGRYVVSYETSERLQILEKYMRESANERTIICCKIRCELTTNSVLSHTYDI
eukprot:COSAG04_NODE_1415_length_6863_cov_9.475163_3_plen_87_part_00